MKLHSILTAGCAGVLLAIMSCSTKLDIPQNGAVSQDDYYQTDIDALQAVSTVYSYWRSCYETRMCLLETLSDNISKGGENINWFSDWTYRNSYVYNAGNEGVGSYYESAYKLIYYCNLIIDKVPGNTDVQKRCIAEAKFFRAYSHFHLAALWGETVPVVDHLLDPSEYHVSRSAEGELWKLVEDDLKAAIPVLPSKSGVNDKSQIRVTAEAAKVILGKAYLWEKKYKDSADILDEVIGSGLYDLWDGAYDKLLHVEANQCCEKVLDSQIPNDQSGHSENALGMVCGWWRLLGWSSMMVDMTPDARGKYPSGANNFPPRKGLWDAFMAEEGPTGYRFTSTLRDVYGLQAEGITVKQDMLDHDMYFNWKNRMLNEDLMGQPGFMVNNQYMNMPYIRYAEVLLLAAEAQLRAGNQNKADTYLNKVRTRAKLPFKTATLEAIKLEKRLELCFEGTRYMDLIRWQINDGTHDAYNALKDQGKVQYNLIVTKGADGSYSYEVKAGATNDSAGFKEGKHEYLPIPQTEIEVNGDNVSQNPGWM